MKPIIQIKVTIDNIEPPIWRRLLVKSFLTFNELHHTLQIAFGWENAHLYQFSIEDYYIRFPYPDDGNDAFEVIDSTDVKLDKLLTEKGYEFTYEYDFGDSWIHTIVVEKFLNIEPGICYPSCLSGERAAPPENCGGLNGYNAIMAAEGKKYNQLVGSRKPFNSEYFNIERVNNQLAHLDSYIKTIDKE